MEMSGRKWREQVHLTSAVPFPRTAVGGGRWAALARRTVHIAVSHLDGGELEVEIFGVILAPIGRPTVEGGHGIPGFTRRDDEPARRWWTSNSVDDVEMINDRGRLLN